MEQDFPCNVVVIEGVDPDALLAAGKAPSPAPVIRYARAPSTSGAEQTGVRPPATQGSAR